MNAHAALSPVPAPDAPPDPSGRPIRSGFAFKNDKLYQFRPDSIDVWRAWPRPQAWTRTLPHGPWRHTLAPGFDLDVLGFHARRVESFGWGADGKVERRPGAHGRLLRPGQLRSAEGIAAFLSRIPPDVAALTAQYGRFQWAVLTLFAAVPEAMGLARHHPTIAWLLALSRTLKPCRNRIRRARALVRRKLTDVVGLLGFPPTRATVKLLDKVPPSGLYDTSTLAALARRLHDDGFARRVGHLQHVPAELLDAWADPHLGASLAWSLAAEWATLPPQSLRHQWTLLREAVALMPEGERPPPIFSVRAAERFIAQMAARAPHGQWLLDLGGNGPVLPTQLPSCPLTVAGLDPLDTLAALDAEGHTMQHCIASPWQRYVHAIARGEACAFRNLRPRATLYAVRDAAVGWRLEEAYGPFNAQLADDVLRGFRGRIAEAAQAARHG